MHVSEPALPSADGPDTRAWWSGLNSYQWFVLVVAILGWLFDTMDQQLFNIARSKAILDLHGSHESQFWAGLSTSIFMIGWATGGIIFGVLGDRFGRAKTMMLTILLYSAFTGLSAISVGFWDFAFYRFLTGLGVGGEFAVGVTLVAEVMPQRARSHALAWLQACSAIGNITAAFVGMALSQFSDSGAWTSVFGELKPWRAMFIVGALPAFLAVFLMRRLHEPEAWQQMRKRTDVKLGSYAELFGNARWRRNAIGGVLLATSGVVGLWGIGFFGFDMVTAIFRQTFEKEAVQKGADLQDRQLIQALVHSPEGMDLVGKGKPINSENQVLNPEAKFLVKGMLELQQNDKPLSTASLLDWGQKNLASSKLSIKDLNEFVSSPSETSKTPRQLVEEVSNRNKEISSRLLFWGAMYGLLFNGGAFLGIHFYRRLAQSLGRRGAFAISFVAAMFVTAYVFWSLQTFIDVCWMVPIMGFFQLAIFGGYAIYFPELFPTRLRSTGTSFCYNVGRYLAAAGPLTLGLLASKIFGGYGEAMSWRYAGVCMCSFYLLGLMALPFLPETKDRPLPE
jgi:MFS family permease